MKISKDMNLSVKSLGDTNIASPLSKHTECFEDNFFFTDSKKMRIRLDAHITPEYSETKNIQSFELAGPSRSIYFEPKKTRAAIVTCGGLCPGLNDVIRAVVMELHYWYNVKNVIGIRYGYSGLATNPEYPPMKLTPDIVSEIHKQGGTILGSSRGHPPVNEMVDTLVHKNINILFCIGGDGTLKGAHALVEEIERRGLKISVVGIPKTVDNDIPFVYKSFGFKTAVAMASQVIDCAHVEAVAAKNGVGLVKLMGRSAGFISAYATCASGNANYCLIPEMHFEPKGPGNLYQHLKARLLKKEHAVIVVAEGAGQHLIGDSGLCDASGNKKFSDIGRFLRFGMTDYFKSEWDMEINVKYISPSYIIRSVPANSEDSILCADLGRLAVDAAMAGKTDLMIGHWHGEFTHVPFKAVQGVKKRVNSEQRLWTSVLSCTGQPLNWW